MAVLIRLTVGPATREAFQALDDLVGESMAAAGGPPAGLMSHVTYPSGDGVEIADVWSTEAVGRAYVDDVLHALIREAGMTIRSMDASPVWSFARP
jgi:hypothetical protein